MDNKKRVVKEEDLLQNPSLLDETDIIDCGTVLVNFFKMRDNKLSCAVMLINIFFYIFSFAIGITQLFVGHFLYAITFCVLAHLLKKQTLNIFYSYCELKEDINNEVK